MIKMAKGDLELVQKALQGDPSARKTISEIAHPIISYHTDRLCRRYCFDNFRFYQCSLQRPKYGAPADAELCEWGNGCYHWILEDLCKDSRISAYQGIDNARLEHYFNKITSSQAFFERWKDWRFGQRTYVPSYIQNIHSQANRIFLGLKAQEAIPSIAQKIGLSEGEAHEIADQIIIQLTKRKRLHLLEQTRFVSIDHNHDEENDEEHTWQIPHHDMPFEEWQQYSELQSAWEKLEPEEQYVIEALVIDEQEANAVLATLVKNQWSIKKGVRPEDTDRQQLYYFRRKSLAKLAKLAGIE